MKRHLIDHPKTEDEDTVRRLRAFLTIDRAARPSRAALVLQRRPAAAPAPLRQFLRIERGQTA